MPAESRQKILIVDDQTANIQILGNILRDDYQLFFATSGEQALEQAQARRPDLILLDVVMPAMDGYEVCRRLKADEFTRDIPVVFVTAMGEEKNEEDGLEAGAIDYLVKPVSPPIVRMRVRNHLELKRRGDLLEELSYVDGLTGIANRRRFDERLDNEWRRSRRSGAPLALLMIDIDHFKHFNDHHGHLAGDDCLKSVAHLMAQELVRPGDVIFRYGGEEFTCLLPDTDLEGAMRVAERLRAAVAEGHPGSGGANGGITISIGAASHLPEASESASSLIDAADQALYRAKERGRNRVEPAL